MALVTQSGSMAGIWAFIGRRLPLGGIYTLGNQAQLGMAEVLSQLADDPRVSAIELHIEGLQDVPAFATAAASLLSDVRPIAADKGIELRSRTDANADERGAVQGWRSCMILGLGSDLIDIRRIEKTLDRFGDRFIATARRTSA